MQRIENTEWWITEYPIEEHTMLGGDDHDQVEWFWAPESENTQHTMLGQDGHGQMNVEMIEMFGEDGHGQMNIGMFGEDGHGQWNEDMWQEEEAGDQPWFTQSQNPSGDDMAGPSGMGGPSGDFEEQDMDQWGHKDEQEWKPKPRSVFERFSGLMPHGIVEYSLITLDSFLATDLFFLLLNKYELDGILPPAIHRFTNFQIGATHMVIDNIRHVMCHAICKAAHFIKKRISHIIHDKQNLWKPIVSKLVEHIKEKLPMLKEKLQRIFEKFHMPEIDFEKHILDALNMIPGFDIEIIEVMPEVMPEAMPEVHEIVSQLLSASMPITEITM